MLLFDSYTRTKQEFIPRNEKKVTLYVCGITPNNATHLGHAFTYVSFDVLVRFLKYKGYAVDYLENATDINDGDDVVKQAKEEGSTWQQIADKWIQHFNTQMDALNVLRPSHYVLATSVIPEIISINEELVQKGFAYVKSGNVYFDISKFPDYGKLCKFNPMQMLMISKERGNNPDDPNKKNPLDFILWKQTSEDPMWDSPWGKGRPGWHIECTAMIHKYLGQQIDIHGGGRDLIFPHHESEIAQLESYTGKKPYVKTWMHIGMVLFEGEKMSKSLGNLILIQDLLKNYSPHAIRWMLLSHHYRSPWEFYEDELEQVENRLQETIDKIQDPSKGSFENILQYLDDDLNTPSLLHYLEYECAGDVLKKALELLGFTFRS